MALFPLRPRAEYDGTFAVGVARARAALRSPREDLRACPHARTALAVSYLPTNFIPTPAKEDDDKAEAKPTSKKAQRRKDRRREGFRRRQKRRGEEGREEARSKSRSTSPIWLRALAKFPRPREIMTSLQATDKRLCWLNATDEVKPKRVAAVSRHRQQGRRARYHPGRRQGL